MTRRRMGWNGGPWVGASGLSEVRASIFEYNSAVPICPWQKGVTPVPLKIANLSAPVLQLGSMGHRYVWVGTQSVLILGERVATI